MELDVRVTGRPWISGLEPASARRRIRRIVPHTSEFEARTEWCVKGQGYSARGGAGGIVHETAEAELSPQELQETWWKDYFSNPGRWWDNRRSKPTPRHPDFRHKRSRVALWLNHKHKPAWVDAQLAKLDAETNISSDSAVSNSDEGQEALEAHAGGIEVEKCSELCESGRITEAVDALDLAVQKGCYVHNSIFYRLLKRCIASTDLILGRRVHDLIVRTGYHGNAFLATHLIGLYASHGMLGEAMEVFSKVRTPSPHNWSSIIFAYARRGDAGEAIRLYRKMRESGVEPQNHIYVAVLKACAAAGDLMVGKEIHAHILTCPGEPGIFVQTGLLAMYAQCGSLDDARTVFDRLPNRDVVAWNAMIAGYAQHGMGREALSVYTSMQEEGLCSPNVVTFTSLLQACACMGVEALQEGKLLHSHTKERGLQQDSGLGSSLVNMYAKCGSLENARKVFDKLSTKDVATWTAMIAGYVQQGDGQKALNLYSIMEREGLTPPNIVTYVCLLQACASVGTEALPTGQQLHAQAKKKGLEGNVVLGGSLVNMYAKCGNLETARSVFDCHQEKNLVTWNAMLTGYVQQGMGQEALSLYSTMQQVGTILPDSITFVCVLQACAIIASLPSGRQCHAQIKARGMQSNVVVGTALVDMYAKCGSMLEAQDVFDALPERTTEAWSALMAGYTRYGDSQVVFDLFDRMKLEGIQPDGIAFVSVLAVCSHVGLVDKGREYFESMTTNHGLSPSIEHYMCMLDLLGRAGHLDEALQMAKTIPFSADCAVWHTLLSACLKWNNVGIGLETFEYAIRADEKDAASYVLMSHIFSRAHMWKEAREMQARRKKCGALKQPGQSWLTDMGGVMHTFVAGDNEHPETESTLKMLEPLASR